MNKWLLTLGLVGSAGQALAADSIAPTVTASVAPGSFTSAQTFTLSIKDNSDTAPLIYYTKDGSAPTKASSLYKKGQKITAVDKGVVRDLFLRTLAVDKSGNIRRQSFSYYVDSAPVVTPSKPAGKYSGSQSITLSVKDESDTAPVIYYTTDGSAPGKSSPVYQSGTAIKALASSADVDLRIRTLAMDSQGNWRRQVFDYAIQDADTTAPVATSSLAAGTYYSAQTLTLAITDDKDSAPKAYYTLDGSEPTTSSALYNGGVAIPLSQSATVKVLAVDASGNKKVYTFAYVIQKPTDMWYFRGTPNNWGKTEMEQVGTLFCTVQSFGDASTNPRFKVDHKGDWTENYPGQDYKVTANSKLKICFDPGSKAFTVGSTEDIDPPTVTALPASGSYTTTQSITLSVTDNVDKAPKLYYTIDGSEPTTSSPVYTNQTLTAVDKVTSGVDLTVKTLAVDAAGNKATNTFSYTIGDNVPPTVAATPAAGSYESTQYVGLSVTDNVDKAPKLYYTTDGKEPTTASTLYTNQTLTAKDTVKGTPDLTVKTLAVDASGNQSKNTFSYYIGDPVPVSGDFRSETIYFVMTARFYDGDSTNNYYNRDRYKDGDPQWRGDFKGLISQLDYIKDLGFTAIWITPPVENRSGLDYHGYHAYDWYKIDPRLESPDATYQDLINAAHSKGMKIVQDVVVNHSSQYGIRDKVWVDHLPIKYYVEKGSTQGKINNGPYKGNLGDYKSPYRDDNDNPIAPEWFQKLRLSDPEGVVPFVDPTTGVTYPNSSGASGRFFGVDAAKLDPQWYHMDGFINGGDWENTKSVQNKHMAGDCLDLATGNQNVKDYLNGAIHKYLDMGVDAIRLDTAKHVERNELLTYTQDWQAHKKGLFVFGEVLVKGAGFGSELDNSDNASADIRPWWFTRTGSDKSKPSGDSKLSVLDFPLFSTFRDNVTKGSFGGIGGVLAKDYAYADPTQLVTFFQNHDVGPDNDFLRRYGGDPANAAMTYNLLWTVRGIPALYQGEEIEFQGGLRQDIKDDPDLLYMTGRAYYGDKLDDKATVQANPLYQHIKRLNQIRKAVPALQKGVMQNVNEWGSGMSFVRDSGDSYVVVGLASGNGESITVKGVKAGTYTDVVTGKSITASGGNLSFSVGAYSAGIYVLGGTGKIGADGKWLK
jgi:Glycosidases